jgi:hypothetical protein
VGLLWATQAEVRSVVNVSETNSATVLRVRSEYGEFLCYICLWCTGGNYGLIMH